MNVIQVNVFKFPSLFKNITKTSSRWFSSADSRNHRNELFDLEKKRQRTQVGRIEKIEVRYLGTPEDTTLMMNKRISTPFNCAQHFSDTHCNRSVMALIDGKIPWDMHRPLEDTCTLQLLRFTDQDPSIPNKVFWRSCSFLLGAALHNSFKSEVELHLHSFPTPNIRSGSFVHDISLNHQSWEPNKEELRTLSAEMVKLAAKNLKFERLEVAHDLALEMFMDNPYKREQLPSISRDGSVTLYRVGDHIDISRGPMIGSSALLGRCTISAVHKMYDEANNSALYRVQGVALPRDLSLNHFSYNILESRSRKFNPARLPNEPFDEYSKKIQEKLA